MQAEEGWMIPEHPEIGNDSHKGKKSWEEGFDPLRIGAKPK